MLKWVLIASAGLLAACGNNSAEPATDGGQPSSGGWSIAPKGDLNDFFSCLKANGTTLLSAHRGGPYPGYPENAAQTMAVTLHVVPTLMEIDVAASSDGVLYLMHDETLDRTTTGTGAVDEIAWADIAKLRLKDETGRQTAFSPPRFSDVLRWANGRTVLQVDFKPSARYKDVIDEINRQDAEGRVILIAYTLASARKLHRLAPEMMISLGINSQSELNGAVAAGIPADRLIGFTGTQAPRPRLFSTLNARDVEVIFATLGGGGSIDRAIAHAGNPARYADIAAAGVDIIATDRPKQAHAALAKAGRAPENGACGISRR